MLFVSVYLCSAPFADGASLVEPLAMRVPCVALEGQFQRGRLARQILHALDLGDLVAQDIDAYVELAKRLVMDAEFSARIADRMVQSVMRAPIFDSKTFGDMFGNFLDALSE